MADSVNLNPFVSSSIIDYKNFIEGKSTGVAKNYASSAANVTYDSEDEESGLVEEQTGVAVVTEDMKEKVEASADNLLNAFNIDIGTYFLRESQVLSTVDWECDQQVKEAQIKAVEVSTQVAALIEKYQKEFLESYTGDGTNIEADFVAFLETKPDYKAINEKFNLSDVYDDDLANAQNSIDDLNVQIENLKKSGKTDDKTLFNIQSLESYREVIENNMSVLKQSQQYRQAAEGK